MLEHFCAKSILACSYKFVGQKNLNNVKKAITSRYFLQKKVLFKTSSVENSHGRIVNLAFY